MSVKTAEMNARERFLETILFGKPDRIPLSPGGGRESTRNRWYSEGLPRDVKNIAEYAYRQAGGELPWPEGGEGFSVNGRMMPEFEEKVIEKKKDSQIVQDWKGNICEISNEFDTNYLRNAIDFVTRRWIKCPVENRDDWEDMKKRYDVDEPSRLPEDAEARGKRLQDRTWPITLSFHGPFWQLREWLGFENLCMLFYDDPELARDMIAFWDNFVASLLEKALKYVVPDQVHLSEDMAYKSFSMISPEMTREYLLPVYKHWGEIIRNAGVPVYAMDSDGYIGELIPIWIEAGINQCDPIEVAAGNDINAFRKEFGKAMAFTGGVDKRCIAKGGAVIEAEIERLAPVIESGGFLPSCDHGVPHDISWDNFVYYTKLLAQKTGWL
ncbi:uroporphyrinogen decarboxylase family protein [Planctomycetota bacterium]